MPSFFCGLFPITCLLSLPTHLLVLALIAVMAVLLDRLLAEPKHWHPLVVFGRWADWLEKVFNRPRWRGQYWPGALALFLALLPLLPLGWFLYWLGQQSFWLWCAAQALILYACIGWQSLKQHVQAIVEADELSVRRTRLSWIVSRDTAELNDEEIAQASCESLLENSSDALFASLFWFAIGGGLAALAHRWVNTLDAMWGYKTARFHAFGCWAARTDDLLAYWPARMTAALFVLLSFPHCSRAWRCWRTQGPRCSSPNGGPVMTAGAGALNVRLSRRASYHGQWHEKTPMGCGPSADLKDIPSAMRLIHRTLWLWLACLLLLPVVLIFFQYAVPANVTGAPG